MSTSDRPDPGGRHRLDTNPTLESRVELLEDALAELLNASSAASTDPRSFGGPAPVRGGLMSGQRAAVWDDLAAWVEWLVATYELGDHWPPCWYQHAGLVEEVRALRSWHRFISTNVAASPSDPMLWHDAYWRFRSRALADLRGRCRGGHRDRAGGVAVTDEGFAGFVDQLDQS